MASSQEPSAMMVKKVEKGRTTTWIEESIIGATGYR
uniref:Uncharacterized protein n=2 Tax=Oryza sativa subsp. japonica TaxID=39947 RepID=Q75HN0_ORYSJ|nr:hypothetical protein OSJNBa0034J04.17 [Oryza sativa Japonica Group]ABF97575.1 hypothetical protein LOC_Os03g41394 [Oryza sativa Japonica Group]